MTLHLSIVRSAFQAFCRRRRIEGEERFDVDFYDFYEYLVSRPKSRLPAGVSVKQRQAWLETFALVKTRVGRRALKRSWDLVTSVYVPGQSPSRTSPKFVRLAAVVGWGEGKATSLLSSHDFSSGAEVGPGMLAAAFGVMADAVHSRIRRFSIPELRREAVDVGDGETMDRASSLLVDMMRMHEIPNDEQASLLGMVALMRPILDERAGGSGWR